MTHLVIIENEVPKTEFRPGTMVLGAILGRRFPAAVEGAIGAAGGGQIFGHIPAMK
jgi:hypothetical protein